MHVFRVVDLVVKNLSQHDCGNNELQKYIYLITANSLIITTICTSFKGGKPED
jgi:hypothetical protein